MVRIPNNIVNAINVDEMGQLWFAAKRPGGSIDQYERSFPARLHFYRKGVTFFMEVSGKVTIEDYCYQDGDGNDLLLKMNLNAIEYVEPTVKNEISAFERMIVQAYNWISRRLAIPHEEQRIFPKPQRY